MKKYKLGALNVSDKGLQDTKEEIVIELIDRMQKYVADGKAAFENGSFTTEQKLNQVKYCCGRFCGLSDFLVGTMGIDVRREDGFMYTQEMYNHFHYWQMMLEIEIKREREAAGERGGRAIKGNGGGAGNPAASRDRKGGEQHDIPYKDSKTRADGPHRKAGNRKKDCRTLGGEYGNGR